MPFASEFDDVYDAVKTAIEDAVEEPGSCARLDESRPAGRITDRLIRELCSASFCVADITDEKPNVMWELGYAMALHKPTIVITQSVSQLPFDIADVQSIKYERNQLRSTLAQPLKRVAIDTLTLLRGNRFAIASFETSTDNELATVRRELKEVRNMIFELVRTTKPSEATPASGSFELEKLTGSWVNSESGSHAYASLVNGELVVPYSYCSNDQLTGVYFDWRRMGEYWFARYQWINSDISGFSFLKQEALDLLKGAWWSSSGDDTPAAPPNQKGVAATWRRIDLPTPEWAEIFRAGETERLTKVLGSWKELRMAKLGFIIRCNVENRTNGGETGSERFKASTTKS
jgi:hypothetical protein